MSHDIQRLSIGIHRFVSEFTSNCPGTQNVVRNACVRLPILKTFLNFRVNSSHFQPLLIHFLMKHHFSLYTSATTPIRKSTFVRYFTSLILAVLECLQICFMIDMLTVKSLLEMPYNTKLIMNTIYYHILLLYGCELSWVEIHPCKSVADRFEFFYSISIITHLNNSPCLMYGAFS